MKLLSRGSTRRATGALCVGLGVALASTLSLVGCSVGAPSAVPTLEGGFVVPTPVRPTGPGMASPLECIASGGDRERQMTCMLPYLEDMFAQVYGPVLTERGVDFEPPTIVYPATSAKTACGVLKRPGYCPSDHTLVLPLKGVARTADQGAEFLLKDRDYWARDPAMARYLEVPLDVLRSGGPMSVVVALAHEYGHHLEALLGSVDHVAGLAEDDQENAAKYSSALELGADCLAGWSLKVGSLGKPEKSQEFGVLALLTAIGDDYGAAATGKASDDSSAFEHGSMEERHDAFIYGYRLAATSQDPYLSCKDSLIAQLKARQAASAQAEPVTLAAAPAAQTSLGLAADDEAIVGAPAGVDTQIAPDDPAVGDEPVEPDVWGVDDPGDDPFGDPFTDPFTDPSAEATDDPAADASDPAAPQPVEPGQTDPGEVAVEPGGAAQPSAPDGGAASAPETTVDADPDGAEVGTETDPMVVDAIVAAVLERVNRTSGGTSATGADTTSTSGDPTPGVTSDPADATDVDPDADDPLAALIATSEPLLAAWFGVTPDELSALPVDDPRATVGADTDEPDSGLLAEGEDAPDPEATDDPAVDAPDPSLDVVETRIGPMSTVDVLTDTRPTGPVLNVRVNLAVGSSAAGSTIVVAGAGLQPSSDVQVLLYSAVRELARAEVGDRGEVELTTQIPAGLEPGSHTIDVRATGADGEPVQSIGMFEIDNAQIVTAAADPGQTTTILEPGDPALERALDAGVPIYDQIRFPTITAAVAVAGAATLALAGLAGLTGGLSPGAAGLAGGASAMGGLARSAGGAPTSGGSGGRDGGGSGDRSPGQTKLKSAKTRKLRAVEADEPGPGDRRRTWEHAGTAELESWIARMTAWNGRYTLLVPRLLSDGAWSRATVGSLSLILWVLGLALGFTAALSVGFEPLPPVLPLVLAIVALSILDASAGALAWVVLAVGSVVTGQVTVWADVASLAGIFVLYVALPLIGHTNRPMRRAYVGTPMGRFDRLGDYVVMPLIVAFAGISMYKALNGLSGLEVVDLDGTTVLSVVIVVALWVRLVMEDVVVHAYPVRGPQAVPPVPPPPSHAWGTVSVVSRTALFILVAAPFFGLGWVTWVAALLLAIPMVMKVWEDAIPNHPLIHKYTPRGLLRFSLLLILGLYLSAWLLGQDASPDHVRQTFNLLLIPGIVVGILGAFGRRDGEWPDLWSKEFAGIVLFALTAGILLGQINLV